MRTVEPLESSRQRRWGAAATWAVALTTAALLAAPTHAAGTKLYVATNGVDTADCGPEGLLPCRSISRAIAHAVAGDEIIVGPGVYGDINRFDLVDPSGDSGEESPVLVPEIQCPFLGAGVNLAMIHIDKPLTIVSRDGAGSTVIDAGDQFPENYVAVNIAADGVVFGKRGKGFTVRNASIGINVGPGVADAAVQGNVAECYMGFVVGSCDAVGARAEGTVLKGNTAAPNSMVGFYVFDQSAVVSGNLAKANLAYGFAVLAGADTVLTGNLAVDGLASGFFVASEVATPRAFTRNAAIGNMDAGLFVIASGLTAAEMTIEKNSFFGNGKRPQYPPANCGLVIQNQGAQPVTIHADGNWWGAQSGPGADPADATGGACIAGAVTMNLTESATTEIRVKPPTK
jgi:hypothetical protein